MKTKDILAIIDKDIAGSKKREADAKKSIDVAERARKNAGITDDEMGNISVHSPKIKKYNSLLKQAGVR